MSAWESRTATVLLTAFHLSACDCGPVQPACAYTNKAAAVFIGTVVFTDHEPALGLGQRTFVKFKVEESFKGLLPDQHEVWADPGSFTSCYAEYSVGERLLVFAYRGDAMPADSSTISIQPGQARTKPLPQGLDPEHLPILYSVPECSDTRPLTAAGTADIEYLRKYTTAAAKPSVRGRVTEDATFGIFEADLSPGLYATTMTLFGNGINRVTRTDPEGYYVFDDVPVGTYSVRARLPPYETGQNTRKADVASGGCGVANFDLIAPGVISGTLLDSRGRPAPNIHVEVLRLDRNGSPIYYAQKQATTDGNGHYRFADLPSGDFSVGVNLFNAPDLRTPFIPAKWSENGSTSVHLAPGEQKHISSFRLPTPSVARKVEAEVHWPDGRPVREVSVWGEVDDRPAAFGTTDENGSTVLDVLEGIQYTFEAKIWVGVKPQQEVARSGPIVVSPGPDTVHLKLVLDKRTKDYR